MPALLHLGIPCMQFTGHLVMAAGGGGDRQPTHPLIQGLYHAQPRLRIHDEQQNIYMVLLPVSCTYCGRNQIVVDDLPTDPCGWRGDETGPSPDQTS
ncbi:hypothetical protein LX36DRAFT_664371 [Colletotrichum falcatum]|nr:hypothetical protein LX36DRAFT_664371 [Colletotrichum falcatum]